MSLFLAPVSSANTTEKRPLLAGNVSAMQQGVKFEVLKRCYIQIYPAKFLLCYEKIIALQHM